ncbi:sugar ABC transporter permease [Actinocorallia libanotica]|uniref:Sugar ABC transporter permease n=1 Tax=Actinocorallia libanotica TaxID=46162 RepID=A0ABP4ATA0_9ACTN
MATILDKPSGGAARPARAPRRGGQARKTSRRLALLLLSPTFLVLALVVGYPVLSGIRQSLFAQAEGLDENGFVIEGERFVGLDNYTALFSGERGEAFWNAFSNTTFFTVTAVTLETAIGVGLALIMHQALRGRALIRASVLVPWAVPTAMSGLLWRWIFQPDGVANTLLGQQILWTADGIASKFAIIIAEVWKTSPFIGLLVLAGLQIIPKEVYEAARVDGASAWQQFRLITLPLIRPALVVAVLFRLLDTLRMFDLPFVLVGANKDSVETLSMLAWMEAGNLRYGVATAYATVLFLYIAVIAYTFVKVLGADVLGDVRSAKPKKKQQKKKEAKA